MNRSLDFRLPGVFFLPRQPAPSLPLPPLDVAAFVGFAERGPLHLPVAIKDFDTYTQVFGGEMALAQEAGGKVVYANLPRAVKAFFANGGRRCYVVRVAGEAAEAARFRLPGVAALEGPEGPRLAATSASSAGAWGRRMRLGTRQAVTHLPAESFNWQMSAGENLLRVDLADRRLAGFPEFRPGDVLRLELQDRSRWLAPLVQIEPLSNPPGASSLERPAHLHFARFYKVLESLVDSPPEAVDKLNLLTIKGSVQLASNGVLMPNGGQVLLNLEREDVEQLRAGDILRLWLSGDPPDDPGYLARLAEIRGASDPWLSPPEPAFQAVFSTFLRLAHVDLPLAFSSSPPEISHLHTVELLRVDLLLRLDDLRLPLIADLAYNAPHPRFWGDAVLLESSLINTGSAARKHWSPYAAPQSIGPRGPFFASAAWFRRVVADPYDLAPFQAETDDLQDMQPDSFNQSAAMAGLLAPAGSSLGLSRAEVLAAGGYDEATRELAFTYLPLGLPEIFDEADPGQFLPPESMRTGTDDLDTFVPAVFYDPRLAPPRAPGLRGLGENYRTLLNSAFDLHDLRGRQLRGMHGLLFIDEVALIGVPDAVQTPWKQDVPLPAPAPPKPPAPQPEPDCPPDSGFAACTRPPLLASVEPHYGLRDQETLVTITGEHFTTTEDTRLYFGTRPAERVLVLSSTQISATAPTGIRPGPVEVRVENENGSSSFPGAFTYTRQTRQLSLPVVIPPSPLDRVQDAGFLAVQQALVTLCQARSDAMAVLSLPAQYDAQHCIEWQEAFRSRLGLPRLDEGISFDTPGELADLSFAAVYHPWLLNIDLEAADRLRAVPPEGAVCGMIARHELERYVWVAPANQPLAEVLGLQNDIPEDDWAELFARQFNLVRPEAGDFRPMSAHTLSGERSLMQISVRRLLIQLRKAAIQLGMDFVFQSNHEVFREGVRVVLENLLSFMLGRGAFAGRSPAESFRVITDDSVNPPQSVEQGRFIAVIQVAPSQPMEFISVQLTRSGEGDLLAEEI